jgi:acyl-coenzyme A synthetase/AMP-(fatty) acid ligase
MPWRALKAASNSTSGVRSRHTIPEEVEFIDALPMTTTGKIQRGVCASARVRKAKASAR